jgi:hypothetical protein
VPHNNALRASFSNGVSGSGGILPAVVRTGDVKKFGGLKPPSEDGIPDTRGGNLDLTRLAASALSRQQRFSAVHGILRASIRVALTHFQGETPMRISARRA